MEKKESSDINRDLRRQIENKDSILNKKIEIQKDSCNKMRFDSMFTQMLADRKKLKKEDD